MVLLIRKAASRICPAGHHVPAASDGRPAGRVREVLPPQGQEGRDQTQTDEAETEATRKVRHTPLFSLFFSQNCSSGLTATLISLPYTVVGLLSQTGFFEILVQKVLCKA
jgi:hypothetical protein